EFHDYLGVYEQAKMVPKRSVFAHSIHLSERELCCLADNNAAISHCTTSNLLLGSGLLNLKICEEHGKNVGMG
ncbi:amidohydrolase family protein, partial [Pseudoalteromonas carrageenovora]|uniref:amidohydrolase family protein n=1 Tax=Pseudoalteromonas carrageenovora TaxID=227 RepID=UPI00311E3171